MLLPAIFSMMGMVQPIPRQGRHEIKFSSGSQGCSHDKDEIAHCFGCSSGRNSPAVDGVRLLLPGIEPLCLRLGQLRLLLGGNADRAPSMRFTHPARFLVLRLVL